MGEAERCLALGALGIKLRPRAQAFGFGDRAAESIWKVASEAKVPIPMHAGRGMPRMELIAACGSSVRSANAGASRASPQGIKHSDCMRAHAVADLPDPSANGGVELPASIAPQAPAFASAQQACANLQPGAGGPRPAVSEAQRKSFVANAQCMRKHGIPNLPDRRSGPGGRGIGYNPPGPRFQAPAIDLAKLTGRARALGRRSLRGPAKAAGRRGHRHHGRSVLSHGLGVSALNQDASW